MTDQPPRPDHGGPLPRWTPPTPSGAPGPADAAPPQRPAWQQLPPEQLARLHQPGVVPLRPLTLGDIFGGALQTMRRNPSATIGTAFLVLTVLLVPSYLASLGVVRLGSLAVEDRSALATLVSLLFSTLASVALTGMIVHVVGEAVLGDRASLAETWAAVRGRLPALLGTLLLMTLLLAGLVLLLVGAVLLILFLTVDTSEVLAVVLTLVAVVAMTVLLVWVGVRLSLAPAAVVLERVGPWRGLRRSWRLTTGGQGWRVLGITVLAGIVTGIFSSAVQFPVMMAVFAVGGLDLLSEQGMVSPLMVGADHLVQLVVNAFVVPFTAGVTALLYLDQRIRREGLDAGLVQAAQARAAARAR